MFVVRATSRNGTVWYLSGWDNAVVQWTPYIGNAWRFAMADEAKLSAASLSGPGHGKYEVIQSPER